ncbi:MAG: hypothetical protein IKJ91_04840, partial [Clostridia bacterium]|nr:hypothetical protein [Clostridia bacterium]
KRALPKAKSFVCVGYREKGRYPRGNALGDFCFLWGGPKEVPRGMSAYAVTNFFSNKQFPYTIPPENLTVR